MSDARSQLASVYGRNNEIDLAIENFTRAIDLNPKRAGAYTRRGINYVRKGNLDAAFLDYNRAIGLDQRSAFAYQSRGYAHLLKGELAQSVADLDRAIALDPKSPDAYTTRGLAYHRKGDRDRAAQDFKKVIDLPVRCGSTGWAQQTARKYLEAAPPGSEPLEAGPFTLGEAEDDTDLMDGYTF